MRMHVSTRPCFQRPGIAKQTEVSESNLRRESWLSIVLFWGYSNGQIGTPTQWNLCFFLPGDWGHCHRWNSGFFYAHCGWTWGNEGFGELGEFSGCNERKNDGNLFLRSDPNRSKQENKNGIDIHSDTGMLWSGMMPCDFLVEMGVFFQEAL